MKRWHEDFTRTNREWKEKNINCMMWIHDLNNSEILSSAKFTQKGRYRKKDAWDCGNPQCGVCHSDKFPKRKKNRKEKLSDIKFLEDKKEFENE